MRKLCETLRQAMEQAGLRDGMTISFHHHLRNGDYVLNMVLDEAAKMGVKDLTVNASSVFDCYEPMLDHIRNGVVTGLETDYIAPGIGRELSKGILPKPIIFRTHGSRRRTFSAGAASSTLPLLQLRRQILWATARASTARRPAARWATPLQTP